MNASPKAAIVAIMMMLSSGCLGAVEDIVDVEDEVIDSVLDWLDSEYPNLDLPERERSTCLLYTSPSPRDLSTSRMPSSA